MLMRRLRHRHPNCLGKALLFGGVVFPLLLTLPPASRAFAGELPTKTTTKTIVRSQRPIKGKVVDSDGHPLQGVTVQVKGTGIGAKTDQNGEFSLDVPENSKTIVISYVGMETREVDIRKQSDVTLTLKPSATQGQDVVVVGYVTQKKSLLTGSVAVAKLDESDREVPTASAGNLLAGRLPGVTVTTPAGPPGQVAPTITIRTANSWNAQPVLYVIDGKISSATDFNNLSPIEIDNITVLKDAATTAAYGSRAAGGVIVVTTRMGKAGKSRITYSFNSGKDVRGRNEALTNAVQWGELYNQINPGSGPIGTDLSQQDLDYFQTHNFDGAGYGYGFNNLKYVYRNPYTATHNLSIEGGNDKIRYFVSGSYADQQGFFNGLDYKKYNLRANITADVNKDFQLFFGGSLNNNITNSPNWNGGGLAGQVYDLYQKLLIWQPYMPEFTTSGKPVSYGWIANMGAVTQGQGGYAKDNYLRPVFTLSGTYKMPFLNGLSAKATFTKSYSYDANKVYSTSYNMYDVRQYTPYQWGLQDTSIVGVSQSTTTPGLAETVGWGGDKQLDFQLNYQRSFGLSHVMGTLVYEAYSQTGTGLNASVNGFPLYTTDQWWATTSNQNTTTPSGGVVPNKNVSNSQTYSDTTVGRRSWVGQFFYDYADKYMASFTYRYDGSMKFAPNERWGFFPSGSLGWIMSKEDFMQGISWLDMLKLRASVGLIGNDNVGGWQWQQSYVTGNNAFFGTAPSTNAGLTYGSVVNPFLTWEKSLNKNIGVDINFLRHFSATAEYWHTYTYDILGKRIQATPPTFSQTLPSVNYGKVKAGGVDLSLTYSSHVGKVNFSTGIVASYGQAHYVLMDQNITYDYQNQVGGGRTTTMVTGYKVDHMIRDQNDLNAWNAANPNYNFNGNPAQLGQFVYKDLSGAGGKPDGVITPYDIAVLRKNNDPVVLGWNIAAEWKGFSIAATFNGEVRHWSAVNIYASGVEWNREWKNWYTNSWNPNNTGAKYPRYYGAETGNSVNMAASNFWYAPSNFLRLKFLNLGYTVPSRLYRGYFSAIRVFASGSNLFIISKFNKQYYDPEMTSGTTFPTIRSFNAGVMVSM
ncbi:MAG TPA: SusC/RagA family TonB-linked outer membrane protein [Puia sp.]|nr:SusC/RagA family TonB-linked outer membrane protein [Puia sp.]